MVRWKPVGAAAGVVAAVLVHLHFLPALHPVSAGNTAAMAAATPANLPAATPATLPSAPIPLAPAEFAPGACVALSPTAGDRQKTVFLDAGHGGPDPGAVGQTIAEKAVTLPVVLDAATLLRANGYRVVLSRSTDTAMAPLNAGDLVGATFSTAGNRADLMARLRCANLSRAAIIISVHFDSYPDSSVGGATTLYDASRPFVGSNQKLAALLQQDVLGALAAAGWQVPDRGVADDTNSGGGQITDAGEAYGHLILLGPLAPGHVDQPSIMPGALVEPLFLSNPDEAAVAADPAGQFAIANGISEAVQTALATCAPFGCG
jgi:N-acetylmuramoyl-L-alanine amidase